MSGTTIDTSISTTVTLGTGNYLSPLTITALGTVAPASVSTAGELGLYLPQLTTGSVLNDGLILGGLGGANEAAGAGVELGTHGTLLLTGVGTVDGATGFSGSGNPGIGGLGVSLGSDAVLVNGDTGSGNTISGGAGGSNSDGANTGGAGITLSSGARVHNYGFILGGTGGNGVKPVGQPATVGNGGTGGIGAVLGLDASLDNAGTIGGGQGGAPAPHYSTYKGGQGGAGIYVGETASLVNTGSIFGGAGGSNQVIGAAGGYGMVVGAGGFASNALSGIITGGAGAKTSNGGGGAIVGSALTNLGGSFTNYGIVSGGVGGTEGEIGAGASGTGLVLLNGVSAFNHGTIAGGSASYNYDAANGGVAVVLTDAALSNSGSILGGTGGAGTNAGTGGDGVILTNASLSNSGTILGGTGGTGYNAGSGGVGAVLTGSTLSNTGTIAGGTGYHGAAYYGRGGNGGAGVIAGSSVGPNSGSFINHGVLAGGTGEGVGGGTGLQLYAGISALNTGTITGGAGITSNGYYGNGGNGVAIDGGILDNTGLITGGYSSNFGGAGVIITGGGTLINAGTIALTAGDHGHQTQAVVFGGAGELVVDPHAVFSGDVAGDSGAGDVLALGGDTAATLTGIGTAFFNFATISLLSGAIWNLAGNASGLASGQIIDGFVSGDTIDLTGITGASEIETYADGILTLASGSDILATLTIAETAAVTSADFAITSDANGGTDITTDTLCYLRGTRIVTPTGVVPVEDIAIGDLLVTRFAGMVKVKWIGRQSFDLRFVQDNRDRLPIRIHAGALGENLPAHDLYVSPGHSMLLENTLVLARNLVNGVNITQQTGFANNPAIIDYFQVELASHDCVIAEGTWSETYADGPGLRGQFQNAAEFYALYPDQPPPQQLDLCAPRPEHGAKLDAALRPIVARASQNILPGTLEGYIDLVDTWRIEGWALDADHPELPVLLEIWVEDRLIGTVLACDHRADLLDAGKNNGNCAFIYHLPMRLPEGALRIIRAADGKALPRSDFCQPHYDAIAPAMVAESLRAVA